MVISEMAISDGRKVKVIRLVRGWSQEDLAHLAKLGRRTISSFEREARKQHTSTRLKIEKVFGFKLNDPLVDFAFAILANDYLEAGAVEWALTILEKRRNVD
jgi:ribosome-binding protein aMBF1 (putative translation factor)